MKYCLGFLLSFFLTLSAAAQTISYEEFKALLPLIQKEDYSNAFKKTNQLLSSTTNDSSEMRGIVTYMNIFSAAGMVVANKMTHADFLKNAKKYIGQQLIMSGHPCLDSMGTSLNTLKFFSRNGQLQGITASTDVKATYIFCYEVFKYATPVIPKDLIGQTVRCGGILESVEVNPNNSKVWIGRLVIKDAFARTLMPK